MHTILYISEKQKDLSNHTNGVGAPLVGQVLTNKHLLVLNIAEMLRLYLLLHIWLHVSSNF